MNELNTAKNVLDALKMDELEQRQYLYFGSYAEYYLKLGERDLAKTYLEKAISKTSNSLEKGIFKEKGGAIEVLILGVRAYFVLQRTASSWSTFQLYEQTV